MYCITRVTLPFLTYHQDMASSACHLLLVLGE